MGQWFHEDNRGRCSLVLSYSAFTREQVTKAAQEAHRMMSAAGESLRPLPGWIGGDPVEYDNWWRKVFGDTEDDLEEQRSTLARRYKRIRWWRFKERQQALAAYISVDQMLVRGHGLKTTWR